MRCRTHNISIVRSRATARLRVGKTRHFFPRHSSLRRHQNSRWSATATEKLFRSFCNNLNGVSFNPDVELNVWLDGFFVLNPSHFYRWGFDQLKDQKKDKDSDDKAPMLRRR